MTLPNFLICGAQKAGTTALYTYLKNHPDILLSNPKETEFFNWNYHRGWEWFASHFMNHAGESAIGEASTRTMYAPGAPHRIAKHLPEVRLIFLLRDPAARAFSAFHFYRAQGIIGARHRFSEFIRNDGHPLRNELIQFGKYDHHLSRFEAVFEPSKMLYLEHQELRQNADSVLDQVAMFLGVDAGPFETDEQLKSNVTPYPVHDKLFAWSALVGRLVAGVLPFDVHSVGQHVKKTLLRGEKPRMAESDIEYLRPFYVDTVAFMQDRLGRDLPHWLHA